MSRASMRRVRLDPPNTFQANGFVREALRPQWIETAGPDLAVLPIVPLAGAPLPAPKLSRWWMTTIAASVAFHIAIAAFILVRGPEQGVLVAGSQGAGVVMVGNSDADQVMTGSEFETTNVTIVTMTEAMPVETVVASEVRPAETVAHLAAETLPTISETAPDAVAVAPAETAPPVLAVDTPAIVNDSDAVNPLRPNAAIAERPTEIVAQAPAETVIEETPAPPKKAAEKPAKAAETPAKKARKQATAGSGGKQAGDARKGKADGEATGTRADKAGKGQSSAAGNAAVTNYPGKVRAKLSRAVSRISRRDRSAADRDVTVAFTVTASGGLSGASIVRGSGSASLDSAALAAVRRAAPFPAIPEGAGRSSWQFTIPLGIKR
jgi:protein TonB